LNPLELTGRAATHVRTLSDPACRLHVHSAVPFLNLRSAAHAAGFDLTPVSSFRDFNRQIAIWNAKFRGDRPLFDANGVKIDAFQLSPAERVDAILLWSALPGASRHHWGTDVDIVDAAVMPAGDEDQLTVQKFSSGGPFEPLAQWLETYAARFGFFRPYRGVLSGMQAEPWHISFAPTAEAARRALTVEVWRDALIDSNLEGKQQVLPRLEEFHARYVAAIDWP
jgi:LAS superfamily LD-carboxypeptidase LdcB